MLQLQQRSPIQAHGGHLDEERRNREQLQRCSVAICHGTRPNPVPCVSVARAGGRAVERGVCQSSHSHAPLPSPVPVKMPVETPAVALQSPSIQIMSGTGRHLSRWISQPLSGRGNARVAIQDCAEKTTTTPAPTTSQAIHRLLSMHTALLVPRRKWCGPRKSNAAEAVILQDQDRARFLAVVETGQGR